MKEKNSKKSEQHKKGITGLAFVGCICIGLGIGMLLGYTAVGIFIGLGVGFIVMAFLRARYGEW